MNILTLFGVTTGASVLGRPFCARRMGPSGFHTLSDITWSISRNKLPIYCSHKVKWVSLKHCVYYQLYFLARRVYKMCDYLVFMKYVGRFSPKSTTAPLKRFVPSSVLQAVRALRNAPAALAVFLAGVAPRCAWPSVTSVFPHASWALSQQNPRVLWFYLVGCLQCQKGNPSCRFSAQGAICPNKLANFYWKNGVCRGINQTWCVIPTIFVSTASIHNARLFHIYDVHSPFLGEVHAIPPSCFVPSSVYRWWDIVQRHQCHPRSFT